MKNVVFVNPPLTLQARYGSLAQAGAMEPPFGLCYLASAIREQGYRASIIDAEALGLSIEETAESVLELRPDYVGLTATTPAIFSASRVAQTLKEGDPSVRTLIGGCHVTAIPEETLQDYPAFDIAVVGEGEETLLELLRQLEQNGPLESVPGLALRRNGEVVRTPPRPLLKDLDTLPMPAFDLLPPLDKHYRVTTQSVDRLPAVSLITSRGCYAQCTFCDTNVTGNTMRGHSAGYVLDMMRSVKERYGIRCVMFEDDNFLAFRKRLREMAETLKNSPLDMTWSCTSRIDIANADTLRLAKSLGCWQVLYGVESGSQKILDFYKKKISPSKTRHALQMTQDAGLYTKGFVIIGNPLETLETLEETRTLVLNTALDDISITYFTPYPGAEVYSICGEYGQFDKNWEKMSCFEIVFVPHGLSRETIEACQRRMFKEFYLRPRILLGYLSRVTTWRHFSELARSGLSLTKHVYLRPSPLSYCIR